MASQETGTEATPMELFGFRMDGHSNMSESAISKMKQEGFFQNRKPGTFLILIDTRRGSWDSDLVEALLQLLFFFHEKGIIWNELDFSFYDFEHHDRFDRPLLHAINTMKIFKKIKLNVFCFDDAEDHSEEDSNIFPGITTNDFVEELEVSITGKMSRVRCNALNHLLQTNLACLQTLELDPLDAFLSNNGIFRMDSSTFNYRWIIPGLRCNRTLKTIKFVLPPPSSDMDASSSAMIRALERNPSLESLEIDFGIFGYIRGDVFERLLSDSTSLRELILRRLGPTSLNEECIIQGLKKSRSLKRLGIHILPHGKLNLARLFRILPDCPLMEYLFLPFDGRYCDEVKLLPRLPRSIQLDVYAVYEPNFRIPPVVHNAQLEVLADLLRCHPEVRLALRDCNRSYETNSSNTEFWHIVHMNWHGRYLLDRPKVPLSIWPLVLEKVNYNYRVEDKASILYGLLKGPAWSGRTSY